METGLCTCPKALQTLRTGYDRRQVRHICRITPSVFFFAAGETGLLGTGTADFILIAKTADARVF